MMDFNHYLIIYDIRDDNRLRKIAKIMEDYGVRVQKSVFEMEATDKTIKNLRERVQRVIENEDYVVYFKICEKDWQKREKYGKKVYVEKVKSYEII